MYKWERNSADCLSLDTFKIAALQVVAAPKVRQARGGEGFLAVRTSSNHPSYLKDVHFRWIHGVSGGILGNDEDEYVVVQLLRVVGSEGGWLPNELHRKPFHQVLKYFISVSWAAGGSFSRGFKVFT